MRQKHSNHHVGGLIVHPVMMIPCDRRAYTMSILQHLYHRVIQDLSNFVLTACIKRGLLHVCLQLPWQINKKLEELPSSRWTHFIQLSVVPTKKEQ